MFRSGLFNFSKGELAPALYGRVDVAAYSAALRRAENVVVLKYGGVTRRMGSRYVYEIKPPAGGWNSPEAGQRLIPFEYSIEQTYMLLLTQAKMRPAALGGMVLEQALTIQAATNSNPVKITAAFHGYANGDEVFFSGVSGMTELNGMTLPVTVIDASNFTVPVDGTAWGVFTVDSGGITNSAPPPPPPPPPPVPPPVPDPSPPEVTPPPYCVTDDTMIMMADGTERPARDLVVGDVLWTRHEETFVGGRFPIEAIDFAEEDILVVVLETGPLFGTPDHRVWTHDGWQTLRELCGVPAGRARVAKITVKDAHTYISNGVLSHNIKNQNELIP
jgi:hypothetical protein